MATHTRVLILAAFLFGCGGDGPGSTWVAGGPGDGSSGLDVRSYPVWGELGSGAIVLPSLLEVEAPPGAVTAGVEVGLRASPRKRALPAGFTALTSWVELASNRADLRAAPGASIALRFPLADPDLAESPGLVALAALPNGVITLDGRPETDATGAHLLVVDALGLPPRVDLALAHNPAWLRLESSELEDLASTPKQKATGWRTVEWTLGFDGNAISIVEARELVRQAREASRYYSQLGLREPFVHSDTLLGVERWHMHLAPADSLYDPMHDPTDADLARRFGRIQLGLAGLRDPGYAGDGGGFYVVAHELFHAVFESYRLPGACFERVMGGVTYCYHSATGFNEGLATALGRVIASSALVPALAPALHVPASTLEQPFGAFDHRDPDLAYRNQDALMVYFRLGQTGLVKPLLEALADTQAPALGPRTPDEALVPYALALDGAWLTVPFTLSELHHFYVVERGYVRTELGHIRPDEPDPDDPGASNRYAPALFPNVRSLKASDCQITEDEARCSVTFRDMPPLSARALFLDLVGGELLPAGFAGPTGVEALFEAEVVVTDGDPPGRVAFTVFGERYGEGDDEGRVGSTDGSLETLREVGGRWTNLKVFVVRGAGPIADVKFTASFPLGGLSAICRHYRDIYCECVVDDVQPLDQCRVQFVASLDLICDPVEGHLPEDMSCDEYCAGKVTELSPACDAP